MDLDGSSRARLNPALNVRRIPPKLKQSTRQGGLFVFLGEDCVWSHYDKATSDHADFEQVEAVVRDLAEGRTPQEE